jgi:hypothetical protein
MTCSSVGWLQYYTDSEIFLLRLAQCGFTVNPRHLPQAAIRSAARFSAEIARLNGVLGKIVQLLDVKEAFQNSGIEPRSGSPEKFAALTAREIKLTDKLLQAAGIKAELAASPVMQWRESNWWHCCRYSPVAAVSASRS